LKSLVRPWITIKARKDAERLAREKAEREAEVARKKAEAEQKARLELSVWQNNRLSRLVRKPKPKKRHGKRRNDLPKRKPNVKLKRPVKRQTPSKSSHKSRTIPVERLKLLKSRVGPWITIKRAKMLNV